MDDSARAQDPITIERGMVESYLLSSMHWSAVRWREHPAMLERGIACLKYLAGRFYDRGQRGFMHLPLYLIVDVMAVIELGDRTPFASERDAERWSQEERRLRIDYENLLLGTLLQESAFVEARERLSLQPEERRAASQRLAEILLRTFGTHYPAAMVLDPAHVRDVFAPPTEDIDPLRYEVRLVERYGDPFFFPETLATTLKSVSNGVYWREVLEEEDLFEIENWAVLDTEAKRIGSRQISEVARRLGALRLPRVRMREEVMEVETDYDDDTVYPTGGFSGLATRGSFENLVRSELVYMGEGEATQVFEGVSLFDMRFVENELLFYMRNDGVMRRKRRFIHIVLDLSASFHHKSPGYAYPFSTLTQGLVVRLTRDLLSTFEEDAITIHIHYLHKPDTQREPELAARERERVDREMALMQLVLAREVRQERVAFSHVEEIDIETMQHARGRVWALAFTFEKESETFWRRLFEDLEHDRPPILGVTVPVASTTPDEEVMREEVPLWLPLEGVPFAHIAQIKNEIFSRILSGRR